MQYIWAATCLSIDKFLIFNKTNDYTLVFPDHFNFALSIIFPKKNKNKEAKKNKQTNKQRKNKKQTQQIIDLDRHTWTFSG